MALVAGQEANIVLARARDAGAIGTSQADVINLLSRWQTIANGATEAVIQSATFTVSPQLQIYPISGLLPQALRIVDVRDSFGRSLDGPLPYKGLRWLNEEWFTEIGPELRSWCLVGKDLLILRPALQAAQVVTVRYAAVTQTLNVPSDQFQCPDDDIEMVLDPVEFILLLKSKDLEAAKPILERWKARIMKAREELR